jgi:hypothetical protein
VAATPSESFRRNIEMLSFRLFGASSRKSVYFPAIRARVLLDTPGVIRYLLPHRQSLAPINTILSARGASIGDSITMVLHAGAARSFVTFGHVVNPKPLSRS